MTAQMNDSFEYQGVSFDLVGMKGEGLFDPATEQIFCRPMHTACWRGYIASYAVVDDELRLAKLEMTPIDPTKLPRVYGREPTSVTTYGQATYEARDVRVPFTGGLLLARDFVRELYVHMGFHPAWKYRVVFELIIEDGRVLRQLDRSEAMAEVRATLSKKPLSPTTTEEPQLHEWIAKCFERQYF
jgi:hypothetical protein